MKSRVIKNQRVSRPKHRRHQHLLEVSVRRDIARMQRIRAVLFLATKIILLVGVIVGLYLGGKECLRRFFWENPDYFLAEMRLNTDGTLTREQVRTTAKIELGENIFRIDLKRAREAIDQLPQVERVELRRVLPNRIEVNITERRPVAWLIEKGDKDRTLSEKAFLVDGRGYAMRVKSQLPEYLSLPVIEGIETGNLVLGQKVRSYEMQAALDLIRLNADSTRFHPLTLDISQGYCVIVTDQLRRRVTFALERVDYQLERLMKYLDFAEGNGKQIQTVNLLVERNTPVTFVPPPEPETEETTDPTATAKTPAVKDAKGKPTPAPKKADATIPSSTPPKSSTPARRTNGPANSVKKKPFRLNG